MDVRWWGTVLLLAASGVAAGEKRAAAAASARLFYGVDDRAEGCPDEAGLRRAIADRVGYDPVFPIAPNDVEVTIAREGDRLVGEVKFVDRRHTLIGGRAFQGRVGRCDELVKTIALSVSIALDQLEKASALPPPTDAQPQAATENPTPALDETTSPAPSPAPPRLASAASPPTADAAERAARPPSPLRFELAAGMAGWVGTAPSFSVGPTVSAAMHWTRLALGVEGRMELPAGAAVSGLPGGEVRTSLVGAGPTACLTFAPYFACGVALLGALHADAPGVPGAAAQTGADIFAGARVGGAIALGLGVSVRVSVDLLADAYGPTVRVAGVDWHSSPVAGGVQVALAWQIP
jgi:hypothetical protein